MRIAPSSGRGASSQIQSCISAPRRRVSSSNFPLVTRRHNRDLLSAATNRDHSRSPKCGNRKTDNSTSLPAKSCSKLEFSVRCLFAAVCFQNYFPVGNLECPEVGLTDPIRKITFERPGTVLPAKEFFSDRSAVYDDAGDSHVVWLCARRRLNGALRVDVTPSQPSRLSERHAQLQMRGVIFNRHISVAAQRRLGRNQRIQLAGGQFDSRSFVRVSSFFESIPSRSHRFFFFNRRLIRGQTLMMRGKIFGPQIFRREISAADKGQTEQNAKDDENQTPFDKATEPALRRRRFAPR